MLGDLCAEHLPEGFVKDLLVDAVIGGVGGVVVFLPQILILFFFILLMEESGYLPRAAFLLDRTMGSVGLSGRSFLPLLSATPARCPPSWRRASSAISATAGRRSRLRRFSPAAPVFRSTP